MVKEVILSINDLNKNTEREIATLLKNKGIDPQRNFIIKRSADNDTLVFRQKG